MKKAIALLAVVLVLGMTLPCPALADGHWHGGFHGGHGGWWWPGAIIGGLVFGVAALVTAPFWALPPAPAYSPPVVYAPPPTYAPQAYQQAPTYSPPPPASAVRREVVYPNGRYVLHGDGVRQPWQWVWVPSASPPPPPPPQ